MHIYLFSDSPTLLIAQKGGAFPHRLVALSDPSSGRLNLF